MHSERPALQSVAHTISDLKVVTASSQEGFCHTRGRGYAALGINGGQQGYLSRVGQNCDCLKICNGFCQGHCCLLSMHSVAPKPICSAVTRSGCMMNVSSALDLKAKAAACARSRSICAINIRLHWSTNFHRSMIYSKRPLTGQANPDSSSFAVPTLLARHSPRLLGRYAAQACGLFSQLS